MIIRKQKLLLESTFVNRLFVFDRNNYCSITVNYLY